MGNKPAPTATGCRATIHGTRSSSPGTNSRKNPPPPEREAPPATSQPRGMKLILEEHKKKLKANWPRSGQEPPVLKIFNPTGSSTWLIHSMDPHDEDTLFGLCDHGFGFPELGYVSLSELQEVRPKVRISINGRTWKCQSSWKGTSTSGPPTPLAVYADAARAESGITERAEHLDRAAMKQPATIVES